LFVFSPKLRSHIPPLLYLNSRAVALEREKKELGCDENSSASDEDIRFQGWAVSVRSLSILLTESRLIVFLYNMVPLSLTILVLKGVRLSSLILTVLLTASLPYYVGSTLALLLYIGKRLNLTDEDFQIVFGHSRRSVWFQNIEFVCETAMSPLRALALLLLCWCGRSQRVHRVVEDDYGFSNNELQCGSSNAIFSAENDEDDDSISSAYIAALKEDSSRSGGNNSSNGNSIEFCKIQNQNSFLKF
jgi:hypothetical protein